MKVLVIWIILLIASPVMALDFNKVAIDETGKPLCMEQAPPDKCPDVATIGRLIRNALGSRFQDETGTDPELLYKRGQLSQQIWEKGNDFKPSLSDLELMRKMVGKKFTPLIIYQVFNELEPPKQ